MRIEPEITPAYRPFEENPPIELPRLDRHIEVEVIKIENLLLRCI
jgi:hypothetical protein